MKSFKHFIVEVREGSTDWVKNDKPASRAWVGQWKPAPHWHTLALLAGLYQTPMDPQLAYSQARRGRGLKIKAIFFWTIPSKQMFLKVSLVYSLIYKCVYILTRSSECTNILLQLSSSSCFKPLSKNGDGQGAWQGSWAKMLTGGLLGWFLFSKWCIQFFYHLFSCSIFHADHKNVFVFKFW